MSDARKYIQSRGLYIVGKKDLDRARQVAVDAYYKSYPLYDLLLGENYSRGQLERMWELNMNMFFENSLVYADSPEINAFAIWMAPDTDAPGLWHFLTHHGLRSSAAMGVPSLLRICRYDLWSTKMRLQIQADKQAWYLFSIQCIPEMQGRHIGSKLMMPMLDYLKENNQHMYLETHRLDNVSKYEHLGISVAYRGTVPKSGAPFFAMMK